MKMFQSKGTLEVPPIQNLELQKYLGRWYEIGKLPKYEQRQLTHVTAYYHLDAKGILRVKNTGYRNGKEREIRGKAWQRGSRTSGALYVQFFWPLKGHYNIIKLAEDYRYAVVAGKGKESLWILGREKQLSKADLTEIMHFLHVHGFDATRIQKTEQKEGSLHGCI